MNRIDHGPMYICVTLGLMCWSLSLLIYGPMQLSVLNELDYGIQSWLAASIFVGAIVKVVGILSSTRYFLPSMDMRNSLLLGIMGVPLVSTAVAVFFFAALLGATNPIMSGLGSALSLFMPIGGFSNLVLFEKERRRITRNLRILKQQEVQLRDDKAEQADYDNDSMD